MEKTEANCGLPMADRKLRRAGTRIKKERNGGYYRRHNHAKKH